MPPFSWSHVTQQQPAPRSTWRDGPWRITSGLRASLPAGRSFLPLLYGALATVSTPREVACSTVQFRAQCGRRGDWDGDWAAVQGRSLWDLSVDRREGVLGLKSDQGSLSLLPGVPGHWAPQLRFPHVENVAFNIVRPHMYSLDQGSPTREPWPVRN